MSHVYVDDTLNHNTRSLAFNGMKSNARRLCTLPASHILGSHRIHHDYRKRQADCVYD
jgi:hypothetical protein